jgi:putative component of toxin-antitoxin plasmid stabilization module
VGKLVGFTSHPYVVQDLMELPGDDLRLLALSLMKKLRNGNIQGKPLEKRKSTGDLSDCFKVLFDVREDIPPRFRIVYRKLRKGVEVVAVEVLSVGQRFESEAYIEAAIRLGRIT